MPVVAIVTIVVSLVLLLAIAAYLIRVVAILNRANDTLGKIMFGVSAIAHRLEPVNPIVTALNSDLDAVAGALEGIVKKVSTADPAAA